MVEGRHRRLRHADTVTARDGRPRPDRLNGRETAVHNRVRATGATGRSGLIARGGGGFTDLPERRH